MDAPPGKPDRALGDVGQRALLAGQAAHVFGNDLVELDREPDFGAVQAHPLPAPGVVDVAVHRDRMRVKWVADVEKEAACLWVYNYVQRRCSVDDAPGFPLVRPVGRDFEIVDAKALAGGAEQAVHVAQVSVVVVVGAERRKDGCADLWAEAKLPSNPAGQFMVSVP